MHRAQTQANDIISKQLELLLLTNNKNFSDFIKDENLQKQTSLFTFVRKKKLFTFNKQNLYL